MSTSNVRNISAIQDLQTIQLNEQAQLVLFFWAGWHDLSKPGGQLRDIFDTLAKKYPQIHFWYVEAEEAVDISEKYNVTVVPTFIAIHGKKTIQTLEGANPSELSKLIKNLAESKNVVVQEEVAAKEPLDDKLKRLINLAPVMLFMKGNPEKPRCGFSRQTVEILKKHSINFASFDILEDEEVRQGLKTFSDWPTYPQLYVNGAFVGGLDIIKEIESNGDLKTELGVKSVEETLKPVEINELLKNLINKAPVMLFMKGSPDAPRCGFSRQIIEILRGENIQFDYFDILQDEDVRQGLKTYSDWPTYPQLYHKGEFIGGLDIIKEMKATEPLSNVLTN